MMCVVFHDEIPDTLPLQNPDSNLSMYSLSCELYYFSPLHHKKILTTITINWQIITIQDLYASDRYR